MEKINKLRDKYVDKYVVSTSMEERERISLLDNLAMSVEKIEEEAEHCVKTNGMKVITDKQQSVVEFCGCLLAILSHELKRIHMKEKPSFWLVAEQISPKDTVKMIYRLDIRQSDHARCQVWVRHALIEGTMGSYFTLLEEDTKILKHSYRTSSFVRDLQKMEAAKSIINNVVTSVHFKIKIDYIAYNDKAITRRMSSCSADITFGGQFNKGSESPDNVATIKDSCSSFSNHYIGKNFGIIKHSDTFSLPGDILQCKGIIVSNEPSENEGSFTKDEPLPCISPTYDKSLACFESEERVDNSKCKDLPACTESEKRVDTEQEDTQFLTVMSVLHKEGSDVSSNNSLTSSPGSCNDNDDTIMDDDNVIVNNIRIISDEGSIKTTEDTLNVYVKESFGGGSSFHDRKLFLCHENNTPTGIEERIECNAKSYGNQYEQYNSLEEVTLSNNIDESTDNCIVNCSNDSNDNTNYNDSNDDTNYNENEKTPGNVQPSESADDSRNSNVELETETIPRVENCNEKHKGTGNINTMISKNISGEHPELYPCLDSGISQTNIYDVEVVHEYGILESNRGQSEKIKHAEGKEMMSSENKLVKGEHSCSNQQVAEVPMPSSECNNELSINNSPKVSRGLTNTSANDKLIESAAPMPLHPTLNICGSLTHSQTSAFKVVKRLSNASSDANVIQSSTNNIEDNNICHGTYSESIENDANNSQKVNEVINVINECKVIKQSVDDLSSSGSMKTEEEYHNQDEDKHSDDFSSSSSGSKTEEGYRNQVNTFNQSVPGEGSLQLANVLSNVTDHTSSVYDDYFVPGIHNATDIQTKESMSDRKNLETESPTTSMSIPSASTPYKNIQNTDPCKDLPSTDYVYSSPSTFSTLSSKLLEKTLFKRSSTLSSSYSSDKAVDEERILYTDSGSDCSAGQSFSLLADLGITDDVIGMKEDHFSTPDSFMGFSSLEELENAISSCKHLINTSAEKSPHRDELVTQLVKLRLKLHELKDLNAIPKQGKMVLGHQFFKQGGMSSTLDCDACATTIFPLLQNVFVCKDCGFHCHKRCLRVLEKPCVRNSKMNNASCELNICPEVPLSAQQYRCADCFQRIPINDGQFEFRLCDYTGHKYCTKCHWNDTYIIPARVINNWDFSCYKVSRQSKHLLIILSKKPDIKLQNVNSALFSFVDELRDVRTLRQQIMMMKTYIITCRIATEQRLLLLLQHRQHFVDSSDLYSLQDLIDIQNNVLLNELSRIHATFGKHIKFDCLLCQGKGFICEFCNGEEIIFPFDNHVVGCCCHGIFHRLCYSQNTCPKCERIAKKKLDEG